MENQLPAWATAGLSLFLAGLQALCQRSPGPTFLALIIITFHVFLVSQDHLYLWPSARYWFLPELLLFVAAGAFLAIQLAILVIECFLSFSL